MAKPKGDASFAKLIEWYLEHCLVNGQAIRTIEGKRCRLNAFARWCLANGVRRPRDVAEDTLEEYIKYLFYYRQPYSDKPLDIASQRHRLTDVKTFLGRLKRSRILLVNPAAEMDLPRTPRRLPKGVLKFEEVERICQQPLLHGHLGIRDRAILETYFATGIRRMELARLNLEDVDLVTGTVMVNQGKNRRDRRLPIANRACRWIQRYLMEVRPRLAQLYSGTALFLDAKGRAFREQQLTHLVGKYVRRAGVNKPGSCNLFRHTTATLMHENGAEIFDVQQMLGHADVSTTMIYIHVSIRKLREVYEKTHPAAGRMRNSTNEHQIE